MGIVYFLVLQCLYLSLNAQPVSESNPDVSEPILGGLSDADVNDPSIKNAAAFALSEIDRRQNSAFKQVLVQIVSAKTQVVEGKLYHLQLEVGASNCRKGKDDVSAECTLKEGSNNQICTVKVWDRPWLNERKVTQVDCSAKSHRRRREALAGGLADADVNEESVKSAADFALSEVDKRSNSAYKHTLVRIMSAKKQLVAGTLYHLQLEVGESNCDKGSSKDRSECNLREGSNNKVCTVKVWDRPWLKKREVTHVDCKAKDTSKANNQICNVKVPYSGLVNEWELIHVDCLAKSERKRRTARDVTPRGGPYDADTDDVTIKSTAAFAVTEINNRQNSKNKLLLVQILSAQTQVVEGSLHHLKLEIGESSCTNMNSRATSECTLKKNSNNQVCDVKVWDRPWLNKREITALQCTAKSVRRRRAVRTTVNINKGLLSSF